MGEQKQIKTANSHRQEVNYIESMSSMFNFSLLFGASQFANMLFQYVIFANSPNVPYEVFIMRSNTHSSTAVCCVGVIRTKFARTKNKHTERHARHFDSEHGAANIAELDKCCGVQNKRIHCDMNLCDHQHHHHHRSKNGNLCVCKFATYTSRLFTTDRTQTKHKNI